MNIEQLTDIIARHDPLLADAVGKMVSYIQAKVGSTVPIKGTDGSGQCLSPFSPCGRWHDERDRHCPPQDCHAEDNHQCHPCA